MSLQGAIDKYMAETVREQAQKLLFLNVVLIFFFSFRLLYPPSAIRKTIICQFLPALDL